MKPIKAHARNTDPETSREAAESVRRPTAKQNCVLAVLGFIEFRKGISDEHLVMAYNSSFYGGLGDKLQGLSRQSESGIRSRRAELVRKGLIVDSGRRVKTSSGRNAIVWRLA